MSLLLRDVITIPERAGAEDYVLRLTDSVGSGHAASTLDSYVVTPALVESFDTALGLVADAVTTGVSRGAFLTGSFGSGKSHFMAVLHAILRHDPAARAKTELQPVIAGHDAALQEKRFLPLAFHLLGAESLEQALFDGYLRQIRALHPGAPLPAVHLSDELFRDADRIRRSLGESAFFAELNGNEAEAGQDEWAGLLGSGAWDAATFDQARSAGPASPQRQELVNALAGAFFESYANQARYVDLDTGLAAIATHAQGLGYDAVVLFLDELVLWLAFAVQDREFFRRESQKLTKLVESAVGHRAIPLVSFVARQMDLRRWFADAGASGAEQDALDRAFRHQDGRFAQIPLGDDNLPYVAQQRLLRPKDAAAGRELEDAFRRLDRRPAVWDVLLDGVNTDDQHRGADEAAFRQTYPFSPVLVSTLRSLASVMQRERTALKVMQQMLVDRRDQLTVDDVIPVGDAFAYIVQGQSGQALDQAAAALFRSANALYSDKLRPILLANYQLSEADLEAGATKPPALVADERLAQTLLLSAVAPNVPALKGLTAARLAALNHGSIVTPLPGNEATMVNGKIREWARYVPEIHLDSDARNPMVRVQLSDVDYESIVEKAKSEDNEGRRRELIKELVVASLGLELGAEDLRGAYTHSLTWRGSKREVDLVFGNVRDAGWLTDDQFEARPGTWRLVIDHPFDEPGHSSAEDERRVDGLIARNLQTQTIVWLPRFFSEERMRDVRRLVILNWLLDGSGDRWTSHANHLGETDRVQARAILESQRTTLRHAVERAIQVAYDAAAPTTAADVVTDAAHERVLTSLDRGFDPQRPVGATLGAAFDNLLRRAFDSLFPGHPVFTPEDEPVTTRMLTEVYRHVERAMGDSDHRVLLQGDLKAVRRVANPLGVGSAGETHFVFGDDRFNPWNSEFERGLGRRGDGQSAVTVGDLRDWMAAMTPALGLREEVGDLVVLAWAALRRRAWFSYGAPIPTPEPGRLKREMELRLQPLPEQAEWARASVRIAQLFGITAGQYLTPQEVASVAQQVKTAVQERYDGAFRLVAALEDAFGRVGLDPAQDQPRLTSARQSAELMQQLRQLDGVDLIRRLGALGERPDAAYGRSLKTASAVTAALRGFRWERLHPLQEAQGEDERSIQAADILEDLRRQLEHDELVASIADGLARAEEQLFSWLAEPVRTVDPEPPVVVMPPPTPVADPPVASDTRRVGAGDSIDPAVQALQAFRRAHPGLAVDVTWRVAE